VDSGCNGVLIWYLPTMDGAAFYYTSEAADIIAAHEAIFTSGKRCDGSLTVTGIKPADWAAIQHGTSRLLMLLNFTAASIEVQVEQPDIDSRLKARCYGRELPLDIDPTKFGIEIEPWGTRVMTFSDQ